MTNKKRVGEGDVTLNDLKFGDKFWFEGDQHLLVEGPALRQEGYAVNLTTYRLTYFWPNEGGITRTVK